MTPLPNADPILIKENEIQSAIAKYFIKWNHNGIIHLSAKEFQEYSNYLIELIKSKNNEKKTISFIS